MLFLPKYGTNGVWADALAAQPPRNSATRRKATSGPRARSGLNEGTRVRIGSTSETGKADRLDLTVTFRAPANRDPSSEPLVSAPVVLWPRQRLTPSGDSVWSIVTLGRSRSPGRLQWERNGIKE